MKTMKIVTGKTKHAAVAIALGLVLSVCYPAAAFTVTPISQEIDVLPGQSFVGTIHVAGGASEETVSAYISDWKRLPNGDREDLAPGTAQRSCGKWISLTPEKFTASAKSAVDLRYSFTVPDDATGSYWTYIMAEGSPRPMAPAQKGDKPGVGITANLRYAIRIVVNVDRDRNVLGKINQVEVVPGGEGAVMTARFLFENSGNTFINARYYTEVRNYDGDTIYRTDIREFYSFPISEFWVNVPIEAEIPEGKYLALVVVDYGGRSRVAGETRFSVPKTATNSIAPGGVK